jgi:hypothetical protein
LECIPDRRVSDAIRLPELLAHDRHMGDAPMASPTLVVCASVASGRGEQEPSMRSSAWCS